MSMTDSQADTATMATRPGASSQTLSMNDYFYPTVLALTSFVVTAIFSEVRCHWLRLAEATGLNREDVISEKLVLPGVRFAVDAYLNFVASASWQEAACSSLTEMFAPTIHKQRISSWPEKYPWIESRGLDYFKHRIKEAHRDVEHGLSITLEHFTDRQQQDRAMQILHFKLDVLWTMLDAMHMAYVHQMPPYFNVESTATDTMSS